MSNKHHDILGVPKHANQHRLSRLTMEVHTDELRIMASAVESYTDELIAALEDAEKRIAELESRIATPSTIYVPGAVDYSDLDTTSKDREVIEAIAECKGWNACRAVMLHTDGNSPVVPDGWVLVPVDATRAMIDAAARVEEDGYDAMHKAMIAAAPQQA